MPLTVSSKGVPASRIKTSARGFRGNGMWIAWSFRRTCHPRPEMASTFPATIDWHISIAGSICSIRMRSLRRAGMIRTVTNCCCMVFNYRFFSQSGARSRKHGARPGRCSPFTAVSPLTDLPLAFPWFGKEDFAALSLGSFFGTFLENCLTCLLRSDTTRRFPGHFLLLRYLAMTSPYLLIFLKPVTEFSDSISQPFYAFFHRHSGWEGW